MNNRQTIGTTTKNRIINFIDTCTPEQLVLLEIEIKKLIVRKDFIEHNEAYTTLSNTARSSVSTFSDGIDNKHGFGGRSEE